MKSYKVGQDINLRTLKKNYQTYRPFIAQTSGKMFWASIAITASFILSQAYLMFGQ